VPIRSHEHRAASVQPVELRPVVLDLLEIGTSTDPDGLITACPSATSTAQTRTRTRTIRRSG